jgi:hypothetical protein
MKEIISVSNAIALKENQAKCLSISASGASCQQTGEKQARGKRIFKQRVADTQNFRSNAT